VNGGEHPPLTRVALERALIVHQRYWRGTDAESDESHEEWFDFMCVYGLETIALALAALGRLEPRYHVRPKTYQKHTLGPAQQKIVDTLAEMGPKRATELAALTGIHERNLRRNLVSMRAREMLTLDGMLWGLPEWEQSEPTETSGASKASTTLPDCKPAGEGVSAPAPEPAVHQTSPRIAVEKSAPLGVERPKQASQVERVVAAAAPTIESAKPEVTSQNAEVVPILPAPSESDEQPLRLGDLPRLPNERDVEAWARRYLEQPPEQDSQPPPPPTDPTA
jgi:hypothetical protein